MPNAASGYSGTLCGELQIIAANGQSSIDTVTVTVGGKAPIYVPGTTRPSNLLSMQRNPVT